MLDTISIRKIITSLMFLSVALSLGIYWLVTFASQKFSLEPPVDVYWIASSIVIPFSGVFLYYFDRFIWRYFWRFLHKLRIEVPFPDLNGIWEGQVIFMKKTEDYEIEGSSNVKVKIKQSLSKIHIDMYNETSHSFTISANWQIVAGNKRLNYVYYTEPKRPDWESYKGFSSFDMEDSTIVKKIQGKKKPEVLRPQA